MPEPDGRLPSVVRHLLSKTHEKPETVATCTVQFFDNGQQSYSFPKQEVNIYSNELQLCHQFLIGSW
jgi:hypothetical protein